MYEYHLIVAKPSSQMYFTSQVILKVISVLCAKKNNKFSGTFLSHYMPKFLRLCGKMVFFYIQAFILLCDLRRFQFQFLLKLIEIKKLIFCECWWRWYLLMLTRVKQHHIIEYSIWNTQIVVTAAWWYFKSK